MAATLLVRPRRPARARRSQSGEERARASQAGQPSWARASQGARHRRGLDASVSAGAAATLGHMRIRAAAPGDRAELEGFLDRWHSLRVSRLGTLEHPLDHAVLVAERDGRLVGVLTYVVRGAECEVLTLHADERGKGVGSALIAEVVQIARRRDARACG